MPPVIAPRSLWANATRVNRKRQNKTAYLLIYEILPVLCRILLVARSTRNPLHATSLNASAQSNEGSITGSVCSVKLEANLIATLLGIKLLQCSYWPDAFHMLPAAGVNCGVEIRSRIAVRRDEFQTVAEFRKPFRPIQISKFVPAPAVGGSRQIHGLGTVASVGGKRLVSGIHC